MALLPEETRDWNREQLEHVKRRAAELNRIKAEATVISVLTADPKWEAYGRYLEMLKKIPQAQLANATRKLNGPVALDPKEYYQTKFDQLKAEAALAAYDNVILVAKTIIEQGEVAVAELAILK